MSPRFRVAIATLAAAMLISLPASVKSGQFLIWNASASVPIGLYRVRYIDKLEVAQLAVVRPPPTLTNLLEEGGYLPRGVPLVKRVLGLAGQTICRADLTVTVDEINVGSARERDRSGRKLPTWQGCHKLTNSEVFLMNGDEPASLDGRYFGPLPVSSIIGRAEPLWISTENR
jgi:conjugative transfer signal peptidase TraF